MKIEKLHDAFYRIPDDKELHNKIKERVIQKRIKTIRKRMILICSICLLVLGTNITCYAFSDAYRTWFSEWIGINKAEMQTLSGYDKEEHILLEAGNYHIVDTTVALMVTFKNMEDEKWAEDFQMQETYFEDKEGKTTASVLYCDTFLAENEKDLVGVIIATFDESDLGETQTLYINNLISKYNGEINYEAQWSLEIDFKDSKSISKERTALNNVEILLGDKKYILKEMLIADRIIIFRTNLVNIKPQESYGISSYYGVRVDIECMNGMKMNNLTCIPDDNGNLFVYLDKTVKLDEIEKIKIDGKKLYEN